MSDQSIETIGNYMSYGPDGERVAAFATEADRTLFEAAPDLLWALIDLGAEREAPEEYLDKADALQAREVWGRAQDAIDKAKGQEQDRTACCPECATGSNLNETGTRFWNCEPEEVGA